MQNLNRVLFFYALLFLAMAWSSYTLVNGIKYNWDTEAYFALAQEHFNTNPDRTKIFHNVITTLKKIAPPERFDFHADKGESESFKKYYYHISTNEQIFWEDVALFKVKPVYSYLLSSLFYLGIPLEKAVVGVNLISFWGIILLSFLGLKKMTQNMYFACFVSAGLCFFYPLHAAGNYISPDIFGTFLLLLGIWTASKNQYVLSCVFLALAMGTRPNYLVLILPMLGILAFYRFYSWKKLLGYLAVAFFVFGCIQLNNPISWRVLLQNQFIEPVLYPVTQPKEISWEDYFHLIYPSFFSELTNRNTLILGTLTVVLAIIEFRKKHEISLYIALAVAVCIGIILHFMIFPLLVDRMMLPFYLLWSLFLLKGYWVHFFTMKRFAKSR